MEKLFQALGVREFATNKEGSKVEQKVARAIKQEIMDGFMETFKDSNIDVMYDLKGKPVLSLPNGLVIGFDFTVKNLDSELLTEPTPSE